MLCEHQHGTQNNQPDITFLPTSEQWIFHSVSRTFTSTLPTCSMTVDFWIHKFATNLFVFIYLICCYTYIYYVSDKLTPHGMVKGIVYLLVCLFLTWDWIHNPNKIVLYLLVLTVNSLLYCLLLLCCLSILILINAFCYRDWICNVIQVRWDV